MFRVIILYAPDVHDLTTPITEITKAFEKEKCETTVKAVKNAQMPDITASEIVILGSKSEGKKPVHSDFKEIIRSLKGINLAGRIAGVFSIGSEETCSHFKEALLHSDIIIYEDNLLIQDDNFDSTAAAEWVKKILSYYKDGS